MPEPETTPNRDTVRRTLMVLLGDRYARAGEVTKAAQCYTIAFDGLWPKVHTDGLLDPSSWLTDAPNPRVPYFTVGDDLPYERLESPFPPDEELLRLPQFPAPPFRVSGKLTLQGDGREARHLNAIFTAPNPFWYDLDSAPPPQRPRVGTGWRIGLLAVALRALGYPTAQPDPWDIEACGRAQQPDRPTLQLYDENWNYAITLAPKFAFPDTVARDYPPPAKRCDECVRMADPWRHVGLVAGLRIDHDELFGPRTDFMPRYPNRGHQ